jgi:uncharacterized protein YycO
MKSYTPYLNAMSILTTALLNTKAQEIGDLPQKLQTPQERRKSAAQVKAVERSVQGLLSKDDKSAAKIKADDEKLMRNLKREDTQRKKIMNISEGSY